MARPMSRRRRLRLLRTVVGLVVLVVAIVRLVTAGSGNASARQTTPPTDHASAPPSARGVTDPFTDPAVREYLTGRANVTAAIYDQRSGRTWTFNPRAEDVTASIEKVDILATLLADHRSEPMSRAEAETVTEMIEVSDNDAAQDLWDRVGGAEGVGDFNHAIGMSHTALNTLGYWGLSRTSAADQVTLLRQIAYPGRLTVKSRQTAWSLMTHVTPSQAWGVTAGLPPGATVAVKNGWLPRASGWQVNCDGIVRGAGYDDVVCIMTRDDATEADGIATISRLAGLLWRALRPTSA